MKKTILALMAVLLLFAACQEKENAYTTYKMVVELTYADDQKAFVSADVPVVLRSSSSTVTYDGKTDAQGRVTFTVPAGVYEVSASHRKSSQGSLYVFNGLKSNVVVSEQWNESTAVAVSMVASRTNQLVIKELYGGGCPTDVPSKFYQFDKYVTLYNNSSEPVTLENLCLGFAAPGRATFNKTGFFNADGSLPYESAGFIPVQGTIAYFSAPVTLEPHSQILIALNGGIDHTQTYSQSVNLSKADYVVYDQTAFNNLRVHPAPAATIPSDRYLKAERFSAGNAIQLSPSPGFVVFTTRGVTPSAFVHNDSNLWTEKQPKRNEPDTYIKVPTEWILDAVEVFEADKLDKCKKRLTAQVDGGYTRLTSQLGHTSYRNVDKAATEALEENKGKLVYDYAKVVEGSREPSGIDAEASMKKGAKIIYQDTNNSSNDFHERVKSSLRD